MVTTYFSYNYITRNLKQSLTRVEQQQDVAREAAYYKAHIGKVKSVDDGVVLLDGNTGSLDEKLRAIEAAYACPGVWRVAAEIETKDR